MSSTLLTASRIVGGDGIALDTDRLTIADGRFRSYDANAPVSQHWDFAGCTILPGLIDAHVHLFDWVGVTNESEMATFTGSPLQARLDAFLAHGVTTIRSCGDPEPEVFQLRQGIASGMRPGPRLLAVGPGLTSRNGHPATTIYGRNDWYRRRATIELDDAEMARREVHRLCAAGADAIKLLYEGGCGCEPPYIHQVADLPPERIFRLHTDVMAAALDEARKLGVRTTVHTLQQERALTAVELGADSLEHGVHRMAVTDDRLLDRARELRVTVTGTMTIMRDAEGYANMKRFHDAGIRVALGTDTCELVPRWGAMTIDEIEGFVQAGLTPADAISAATGGAAAHIGRAGLLGTLEPGAAADLIVVEGDPLLDVGALRRVVAVIKGGELLIDNR